MVLPGSHITPCGGSLPRQQLGAFNRNLLPLDMLASGVESALQAWFLVWDEYVKCIHTTVTDCFHGVSLDCHKWHAHIPPGGHFSE